MWCQKCHREVAAVPASSGEIRCPFCGELARSIPSIAPAATDNDAAVSTQIFRTDTGHVQLQSHQRNSTNRDSTVGNPTKKSEPYRHSEMPAAPIASLAGKSWINLTGFFVFVFLLGQSLTVWAFLVGHFGAWALGQLFVCLGIAVTLWLTIRHTAMLVDQQRQLVGRINRLNKLVRNSQQSGKTKRLSHSKS